MNTNIFNRISFWATFLVIVLLPIFFLPFTNIPIETSKGLLLVIGLSVSIIFWAIDRFFDGNVVIPKSAALLAALGVVLAFLLSALFSGATKVSFFGTMLDTGTFWFIFGAFLLMFMSSIVFRDPRAAKMLMLGTIFSSAVVLFFQIAHLLLPQVLSLGVLVGKTDNTLGSWSTLGLFAVFSAIMSLLVLEFFSITRGLKWVLQVLIVLSLIVIATVNYPFIWGLLGVFSLIIFVYKVSITNSQNESSESENKKVSFPTFSFVVVIVSLLFFVSGQFIGGILPSRLGISNNEVSPSFSATMLVTKSVLKADPVLGMGPNKFSEAWSLYKPAAVNTTSFWDIPFNAGFGLLPTFLATTGIVGILAWLVFFVLFIMVGVKSFMAVSKRDTGWQLIAFFVLSLYLFIASFFYFTGAVMFLLAFAFTGVFIGVYSGSRSNGEITISFLSDHRKSFFSILLLIFFIIASAAISFKYLERFTSFSYFREALAAQTIPLAETSIKKALSLYSNDLYLRTYAQIQLLKLNSLAAKGNSLSEADKADLQTSFDQAVNGANLAIVYNGSNYLNYQALGLVYQNVGSFGVKDSYSRSIEAYKSASALNPLNPGIKLSLARVSFSDGKTTEAKSYAKEALTLKQDYIDALIFLSQVAKSEGNTTDALSYANSALSIAPTNKDLIQYVDSLKNGGSPKAPPTTTKDNSTDLKKAQ